MFISISYSRTIPEYRHVIFINLTFSFSSKLWICHFHDFWLLFFFVSFLYVAVLEIELGALCFATELCHQPHFFPFLFFVCLFFPSFETVYLYIAQVNLGHAVYTSLILKSLQSLLTLNSPSSLLQFPAWLDIEMFLTCFFQGWGIELRAPRRSDTQHSLQLFVLFSNENSL